MIKYYGGRLLKKVRNGCLHSCKNKLACCQRLDLPNSILYYYRVIIPIILTVNAVSPCAYRNHNKPLLEISSWHCYHFLINLHWFTQIYISSLFAYMLMNEPLRQFWRPASSGKGS
ncbi:hypothetical protein, unlikely [Trypanosoma brucei gambiense DAL972]|uniref:Uncharacterized protein n=1 Tax=Trypanosoma brucei gambiense (strain MHOM/CI/86/DAL972) TaxID=679716 RepID=D0A8Q2_TRYB9|nr:hypothetical protein, unlikely [Trypanosoma brucei gambiense DAL972]CBH18053.1 hypothetical protein, unlikely [Trypanosoma brucei gambiense DAL972]|eukprot:XP_011780317.1 hypothetical protein, unlikely [Trypanosoma brucei gambiense DAL972]